MSPINTRMLPRPAAEATGATNGAIHLGRVLASPGHLADARDTQDDAARQHIARRRLERHQEEKRLNQALREVFEDDERF